MHKRLAAAVLCVWLTPVGAAVLAPEASAESCEAHLAKHGVTKQVDIEDHRAGIQPGKSPCADERTDDEKPRERDDRHDDADMRRDHAGFHCYHLRCG